jgi:hypothetical protein
MRWKAVHRRRQLGVDRIVLYVGPVATAFCLRGERSQHALSATRMSTAMLGVPLIGLLASTWFLGESLEPVTGAGRSGDCGQHCVVSLGARRAVAPVSTRRQGHYAKPGAVAGTVAPSSPRIFSP